jgi:hypothetical protein
MSAGGVSFPISETGAISVGVAYDLGLTDLYEDLDYKTRTLFLFVSYSTLVGG